MFNSHATFPEIDFDAPEPATALDASPGAAHAGRLLALRAESEELQADIDALDESIAWLRAERRALLSARPVGSAPRPAPAAFLSALLNWRTASAFLGCFIVGLAVFS